MTQGRRSAPRRPSLVRRLVLLAAGWSLAVLVAAGLSLSMFFSQAATARFDDKLSDTIDGLLASASVEGGVITPPFTDARSLRAYSGEYWEIATIGRGGTLTPMIWSRSLWDRTLAPPRDGRAELARTPGKVLYFNIPGPIGQRVRLAALQGRLSGLSQPVLVMSAEDRSQVDREIRAFVTTVAIAMVLLGAGLITAVIVQVRVGLGPLFALRREVAAIRTGASDRIVGDYPEELAPLAGELNALMAHNQDVVERQRTHVGNLAHALKTPLSVIITEADQRPGPLADVVARQAAAMGEQVDHHLRRARAAARSQGTGEHTAVAAVLDELCRTLERIFRGRAVIDWRCEDGLEFLGERQDLLEIAGNVIENACKWCAGRVRVHAEQLTPRTFALTVEDDGAGLTADQHGEVLRRGARLDENAPGSGLGLAIVDELVRAYGGAVELSESSLGGLQVTLTLPRAAREDAWAVFTSGSARPRHRGRKTGASRAAKEH